MQDKPRKVLVILLLVIGILNMLHLIGGVYVWITNVEPTPALVSLFHLDSERNVPTLFSTLLLLISSVLLMVIARARKNPKFYYHWILLACIFVFLGMDEAFAIHEALIPIFRDVLNTSGIFRFAWVIPYGIALMILVLVYSTLIFSLPRPIRKWVLISGSLYVTGAILMELVGGYFFEVCGGRCLLYQVSVFIEENLEMVGLSTFIFSLTFYITRYLDNYPIPHASS